jgi:hypothetical protein
MSKVCSKCNSEIDDNAKACPICGAPQIEEQLNKKKHNKYAIAGFLLSLPIYIIETSFIILGLIVGFSNIDTSSDLTNFILILAPIGFFLGLFFALPFSIAGIVSAKNYERGYKGLAIAGIALSILLWVYVLGSRFINGISNTSSCGDCQVNKTINIPANNNE